MILGDLGRRYSMERVREHRVREAKMLMELPQFRSAIEAIRNRLKVRPEELRNKVRVFVRLDGTPAYSLLEKHLRQMNLDIAPRGFREEIRDLQREFSLRSWWWEEWLVRYVLFDEFHESASQIKVTNWANGPGQLGKRNCTSGWILKFLGSIKH